MTTQSNEPMSKRVNVYLPDETASDLEQWAKSQGHTLSSLAAFLIDVTVKEAKEKGDFPLTNPATICRAEQPTASDRG